MGSRWKRAGLLCGILAGLGAATGCTQVEVLTAGNGTLVANVRFVNTAGNRFESTLFTISQLRIRPLDPTAEAVLGADDITLLDPSLPLFVDFNLPEIDPVFLLAQPLTAGRYQISSMTMTDFSFFDFDPPASSATCEEFTTFYSDTESVFFQTADLLNPVATVTANAASELTIVIDVGAFLASYQSSHACVPNGPCGLAWCVVGFDPSQFVADSPTYMSFE